MKQEEIRAKLSDKNDLYAIKYAVNKLNLPEPRGQEYGGHYPYVSGLGYLTHYSDGLLKIGKPLYQADRLEKILARDIVKKDTRDEIKFLLALDIYPSLVYNLHQFWVYEQYGLFKYNSSKLDKMCDLEDEYKKKLTKAKSSIKNKEVLHRLYYKEAERFEMENFEKLKISEPRNSSPSNRSECGKAANLWFLAKNYEKAEMYFEKEGPYGWVGAATMFDEVKDERRAIKFWTLAGKNPTGYFDEIFENSGRSYEKAGRLEDAIKSFEQAISIYEGQDGGRDLHGDDLPGKECNPRLLKRIKILRELIKQGKGNLRNPIKDKF